MTSPDFSDQDRQALVARLRADALTRGGEFDLSSGGSSSVYVDVKQVSLTSSGADLLGRGLWSLVTEVQPDARAVGGMTLGADPLVTAIALAADACNHPHPLASIIVRKETKEHGTGERVESPESVGPGETVVAVDDVVTTGGSTLDAIEQMREAGFQIDHAVCVVDRQAGGRKNLAAAEVSLHSLWTLDELVDEPDDLNASADD